MPKLFRVVVVVAVTLIAVILMAAFVSAATPPHPTYGTATVDGDASEWDLAEDGSGDFFANMYRTGNPTKPVEAKLYLRYDCDNNILYALVKTVNDLPIDTSKTEEQWINIDGGKKEVNDQSGDNGIPPDFHFVPDAGTPKIGWEASVSLTTGNHTIQVHTNVLDGGSQTADTTVKDLEIDCSPTCSLGDYVWYDVNGNGIRDASESGIDNVTVNLYKYDGTSAGSTTTSGGGIYSFTNLAPGDYYVEFVAPSGYVFTTKDNGDDTLDSDADTTTGKTGTINLSAGETDLTWDAGLHRSSIGDRVWYDEDDDGEQTGDYDQEGWSSVDVYLYEDNGDGIFDPDTDTPLSMTTTASGTSQTPDGYPDGIYDFYMGSLGPGQYWVWVDESTLPPLPGDYSWLSTTGGDHQFVDYPGGDDFSFDFGYIDDYTPTAVTLSSFAAKSSAGGSASPVWLGLTGLTMLAIGSLFWVKRRVG